MDNHSDLVARLSPERRALLARKMKEAGGRINAFPLSFAQRRLWFLEQLQPGSGLYNIATALRLSGSRFNDAALRHAVRQIAARHEVLRTGILNVDGEPMQVVRRDVEIDVELIDLTALPRTRAGDELERIVDEQSQTGFELSRAPLFRACLVREAENEHVLIVVIHHVASDGWSTGILVREFASLYEVFGSGEPSTLAPLTTQYADFAAWQNRTLQGESLKKLIDYWRGQLAGKQLVLELPTDRKRPPIQTFNGARVHFELEREIVKDLKSLSRQHGATLFMTMLTAFKTLLHRYTGQENITIGIPIAGRKHHATEALIGFFVNTLVISTEIDGQMSSSELIGQVRQVLLDAYAHQDLPFEKLVEELQPERDMSVSPVVQAMFMMEAGDGEQLRLAGLEVSPVEITESIAKYELTMHLGESDDGVIGSVEYNTDLFDRRTIERLIGHFKQIVIEIGRDCERRIRDLEVMTESEEIQLRELSRGPVCRYGDDVLLHQLFELQAERSPEATALIAGRERISYRNLNDRANDVAEYLRGRDRAPDTVIGLCVERGAEMVVGVLGILKSGCAFVPLDPHHPRERLVYIVSDSKATIILTNEPLRESLSETGADVISIETLPQSGNSHSLTQSEDSSLAYLLYTSGTTGRPKGVMVQHRSIVNFLNSVNREFGLSQSDVMPFIAPLSFDISLFELFLPLMSGGTSIVLTREDVLDIGALANLLDKVTLVHTVPSLMRQIVGHLRESREGFRNLRKIFIGGDQVPADLLDEMRTIFPSSDIHVLYGPTETTIVCSSYNLPKTGNLPGQMIGKPLANIAIQVYDRSRKLVPIGVSGEIYIGGAGVSAGYLNQPQLTAERFVTVDDETFYRSGDLGRYRADGNLEFLGRIDDQVKVRGMRIEPAEIEAVISDYAGVIEAAVTAFQDRGGENQLVAYVAASEPMDTGELRAYLKTKLPEYMVPAAIILLECLPVTPNGKIDRRALPAPDAHAYGGAAVYEAPQNSVERVIAGVWCEVLGSARVGANDNFFDLGGHSLLVIKVHTRLQQHLGAAIRVVDLFKYPTVRSLASHLARNESETEPFAAEQALRRREAVDRQKRIRLLRQAVN